MLSQTKLIDGIEKLLATKRRIDTAFSVVLLTGENAYKLKREVRNGFLDYSSLWKRKALCEREFMLNKKTSPDLYKRVVVVCQNESGSLKLWNGEDSQPGVPMEYLIEMNRFDEKQLLSGLASHGLLKEELCRSVAAKVTEMHAAAPIVEAENYPEKFLKVANITCQQFRDSTRGIVPDEALETIPQGVRAAFDGCRQILAARCKGGFIRECHGDLHLGNICIFNGTPCIFDAVEFNTEFTHIDTLYDLAFLIMDLHHHGLPGLATQVAEAYCTGTNTETSDYETVMPLYLGLRAIIRCSISSASSRESTSNNSATWLRSEATKYLKEAFSFLDVLPKNHTARND